MATAAVIWVPLLAKAAPPAPYRGISNRARVTFTTEATPQMVNHTCTRPRPQSIALARFISGRTGKMASMMRSGTVADW